MEANILMGDSMDPMPYVRAVCLDQDLQDMPLGLQTRIGDGGIRLSGGQQKRVALARTLAHARPILILDDPFSALDRRTEAEIFRNLQEFVCEKGLIVLLISHRLTLFPQMDQVIWMERNVQAGSDSVSYIVSTHEELCRSCARYAELYEIQAKGGDEL